MPESNPLDGLVGNLEAELLVCTGLLLGHELWLNKLLGSVIHAIHGKTYILVVDLE